MQRTTEGWGSGLLGVIIFSGSLPATRVAVGGFTPLFLTSARAVIAALLGAAGLAAGSAAFAQGARPSWKPEPGANLRVLRWAPFVKGDEDAWLANTRKFTERTGVEVRIDKESWEDIRPKAAVAANVGSGPDIMLVWFDDAHQYPDKLLDVTDVAQDLSKRLGGYYPGLEVYAKRDGRFIALPLAAIGTPGREPAKSFVTR